MTIERSSRTYQGWETDATDCIGSGTTGQGIRDRLHGIIAFEEHGKSEPSGERSLCFSASSVFPIKL